MRGFPLYTTNAEKDEWKEEASPRNPLICIFGEPAKSIFTDLNLVHTNKHNLRQIIMDRLLSFSSVSVSLDLIIAEFPSTTHDGGRRVVVASISYDMRRGTCHNNKKPLWL